MVQWIFIAAAVQVAVSVLIAQTSNFVPEEHWHSTEIAYKYVHGRGHYPWECYYGVKSSFWPAIIVMLYKLGYFFEMTSNLYLTLAPQLVQATLTLVGYQYFFAFTKLRLPELSAEYANMFLVINWFTTYCGSRLIEQQTEFSLNCIGLWFLQSGSVTGLGCIIALGLYIRPLSILFWVPLLFEVIVLIVRSTKKDLVSTVILFSTILAVGNFINIQFFGDFGLSWHDYFNYTIVQGGSALPSQSIFWYFLHALPLIILLPFVSSLGMFGECQGKIFALYFFNYVVLYSFIGHKELRYMLPGMPLILVAIGCALGECQQINAWLDANTNSDYSYQQRFKVILKMWILANIFIGLTMGFRHNIGQKPISKFLNTNLDKIDSEITPKVWFLMPCYTMPIYTVINHPTAEFTHYACIPEGKSHLYNYSNGNVLKQTMNENFANINLELDIQSTVKTYGSPHFIVTTNLYYSNVTMALAKNNLKYKFCHFQFNAFKSAPKMFYVLCNEAMQDLIYQSKGT